MSRACATCHADRHVSRGRQVHPGRAGGGGADAAEPPRGDDRGEVNPGCMENSPATCHLAPAGGGHGRGGEEDAGGDPGDVRQGGGRGQEDRHRGLLTPDQAGLVLRVLICPTPAQSILNLLTKI